MHIKFQHHLIPFAIFFPAFVVFSSSLINGISLFITYYFFMYIPGYVIFSLLAIDIPDWIRSLTAMAIGIPVFPQIFYYLSLFLILKRSTLKRI